MKDLKDKLIEAQKYAISIRPKVGGFPVFAEALRQAGVEFNRWSLPSCQSIYVMKDGCIVQQGTPLVTGTNNIPVFNLKDLLTAIQTRWKVKLSRVSQSRLGCWSCWV